jgi:selenide,water dikinase
MMTTPPLTRDLVLIGGGHTHALVLRRWGMRPLPGARLTVINPGPTAPYTGMLPGYVAGHYARDDLMIDLVRLARFAGARLILGAVTGIDRATQRVHLADREIAYDLASINIGITSDLPSLPGFTTHGIGAKPLGHYAQAWVDFLQRAAANALPAEVAVIGGGVGGVELSLAMAHALQQAGVTAQITVLDRSTALPGMGKAARTAILAQMVQLGVTLIENAEVREVTAKAVVYDGGVVASRFTVGAAGARPQGWLASTGLELREGFICVDKALRSSDPLIYAAGDCAALPDPRPKAGVFAVREAPILFHNLRADLSGTQRKAFRPQSDYLKLISLGRKSAVADKWGLRLAGPWLWRWKDRIDQSFMDKFRALPAMPAPKLPKRAALEVRKSLGAAPICGGCGAKVGGPALARVLADLPTANRPDITHLPGDDAAVLRVGGAELALSTDHLRAFTLDPYVMARIAALHAMGDIWAMGATPQAALAQIILPPLSPALQERWLSEIMQAATDTFTAAGAQIAGGHTTLGAELTLGFSVTGLLEKPAITLAGARPGDALILTKPIGSGTILAGEMATRARGEWVAEALQQMSVSQGDAARILATAQAMTDVTGFGLAGHLMGLCRASGVCAELSLADIPVMAGAEALATQGIRSSLFPANKEVAAQMQVGQSARASLLFDPQTAGGLLAAVAPDTASALVNDLKSAGYPAAIIGKISAGAPFITVR